MPSGTPRPASAAEIARNGHVAAMIRKYLQDNNLKIVQFAELIGFKDMEHKAQLYKWTGAKAVPGHMYRNKIAKLLGVRPEALLPHDGSEPLAIPPIDTLARSITLVPKKSGDVISFSADAEGMARLRLDATMPVVYAMQLLRTIMDAGIFKHAPSGE